jgi:Flp pilus assembly protein TadB
MIRAGLRNKRELRRKLLNGPKRAIAWTLALGPFVLVAAGVLLLLHGAPSALGVALFVLALVLLATPSVPVLAWKVRRRQRREREQS